MPEEVKPKELEPDQALDAPIQEAAQVAEALEENDEGVPTDSVIEEIAASDKAAPAAEAILPEAPAEVTDAGVKTHHEGKLAEQVMSAHQDGSIIPAAENHPVHAVDGSNVTLPGEEKSGEIFPPVMKTGEYASGDTAPLEKATQGRWGLLRFAKLPKILGGKKAA